MTSRTRVDFCGWYRGTRAQNRVEPLQWRTAGSRGASHGGSHGGEHSSTEGHVLIVTLSGWRRLLRAKALSTLAPPTCRITQSTAHMHLELLLQGFYPATQLFVAGREGVACVLCSLQLVSTRLRTSGHRAERVIYQGWLRRSNLNQPALPCLTSYVLRSAPPEVSPPAPECDSSPLPPTAGAVRSGRLPGRRRGPLPASSPQRLLPAAPAEEPGPQPQPPSEPQRW